MNDTTSFKTTFNSHFNTPRLSSPSLCSYCALPLSPPLGVTYDQYGIDMLIPSSWCHIESRQSHRWAQRRQTGRTTTPCSRSTCSTARGSSSPVIMKYFELWSYYEVFLLYLYLYCKYFEGFEVF